MSQSGTLSKLLMFAVGAAVGSAVTWKLLEKRYEQRVQEDTQSIREAFENAPKYIEPDNSDEASEFSEEDIQQLEELNNELGYVNYSNSPSTITPIKKEKNDVDRPYVISPEEFGECDYRTISLTYYKDKVLADDMDNIIDDVDEAVGLSSLETFGQYEDDSVFVRNDSRKHDYEICLDERTYSEVTGISPHQMED